MKSKPYNRFISKMFFRTFLAICLSVLVIMALRSVTKGQIGEFIVNVLTDKFDISRYTASKLYFGVIGGNLDIILMIFTAVAFLGFFIFLLKGFTKYFDEIIEGVNKLAKGEKIGELSEELEFMEKKLKQVQNELEESKKKEKELEQRKNDLIVYLAHDIKTPLTSVIGYLNLLDENPEMTVEEKAKYTKITLDKAYRLEKLINEFFEITRYTLQTVPINKQEIDLCCMVVQIVDELYPKLIEHNKEIYVDMLEDIMIFADAEKIARVFNNILKNAISYSDENSKIGVIAKEVNENIEITFRSNGEIQKDKVDLIFDKFYRVDTARQSATGGSGLGLAISKDIVNLHGGDIDVYCNDGFTEFRVILPVKNI
ncbi:MAG: sensor histidine kinase [Sarcina sp.]